MGHRKTMGTSDTSSIIPFYRSKSFSWNIILFGKPFSHTLPLSRISSALSLSRPLMPCMLSFTFSICCI